MNAVQRRSQVLACLQTAQTPLSASHLAAQMGVSRQIIVGDIALLRACGHQIFATPRGYLLQRAPQGLRKTVACVHTREQMEQELNLLVDNGCTVLDVIVEHPVYGQLTGSLQLHNRYDVKQFIERAKDAPPLSQLTEGIHLHTLLCPDEAAFERVQTALRQAGLLLE